MENDWNKTIKESNKDSMYCDEVSINLLISANKNNPEIKSILIQFDFSESSTKRLVARITMPMPKSMDFYNGFGEVLKKAEEIIKSSPKEAIERFNQKK